MEQVSKNKVTLALLGIAVVALAIFGLTYTSNSNNGTLSEGELNTKNDTMTQDFPETNNNNPLVTLKTSMGDITLELYMDRTPITAGNFTKLTEENFYDNTKFHRVIDNFMIQGGDPNSAGDDESLYGRGGPGYTIEDEFDPELSNLRGTIAMANIGQPNSGGSQFFINVVNNIGLDFDKQPLTSKHPVFGHVVQGMDIVDAISKTEVGPRDVPLEPVVIEDVVITRADTNQAMEEGAVMMEENESEEEDFEEPPQVQ